MKIIMYRQNDPYDMKAKILRGEYPVGSKLPSTERELSEYYNVSRIPVREALKALSDMEY